ncbi:partitioning defective 3 homolog B [Leptonychotes weddellii]|uniref:Partitioning defective 3 homolog B n=1 Tax=Leptonychotes weddellii TaxID=9713 RepID=A0A2U3YV52_LEPWE|nr:partitioning defective 3 homolog B [Leptonychotes weddellii]
MESKQFIQAQDVFRQAMKSPSVLLHVLPPQNREQYEKSVIGPLNIFGNNDGVLRTKLPPPVHGISGIKSINLTGTGSPEEDALTSLQQSKSPRVPRLGRKPSSPSLSPLMGFGSKKNAKKIKIDLKKGPEGLGFTVVTRDSSIHGPGPIFVKNILPKGAAIKDGRLQSGDRILEKGEPDCYALSLETTEQLTFEIPLNDSGSAGLGVSLKGNKSRETGTDLGIFIKSIIHGGAAFKEIEAQRGSVLGVGPTASQGQSRDLELSSTALASGLLSSVLCCLMRVLPSGVDSAVYFPDQHMHFRSVTPARQPESMNLKASKSMDLVPDESKVHSLAAHKSESPSKDFGPTLGLKKSSSLESLQTAVAEVRKNELPFHRPRPHMVRGRGCNESFRAAIDKSYDGPEELEADRLSDKSSHSGQGALNCESTPQGNLELEDAEQKARKIKKPKEKDKKKDKGKLKVKEKKLKEENEDPERKIKKKGFGAMLRYGCAVKAQWALSCFLVSPGEITPLCVARKQWQAFPPF